MEVTSKHSAFRGSKVLKVLTAKDAVLLKKYIIVLIAIRLLEASDSKLVNINQLHSALHFWLKLQGKRNPKLVAEADGIEHIIWMYTKDTAIYSIGYHIIDPLILSSDLLSEVQLGNVITALYSGITEDRLKESFVSRRILRQTAQLGYVILETIEKYLYGRKKDGRFIIC
jgi:hypothetical protein